MKAVVWNGTKAELVDSRPLPQLRDDYLLIKTVVVAINPTDAKALSQGRAALNGLFGCDFAGTIEGVGFRVAKPFKKGDRVCGCAVGANASNPEDGAFAEYIVAKGDTCIKIPESITFEEASTIPVSAITDGQGFHAMGLNLPDNPINRKEYILIYGGSSSTGTLAIQYARLAGYSVLTTCAPRNFDLVKSRGAEAAFDYNDPLCGQKIHTYTEGKLQLVFDTIGSEQGIQICMIALSTDPGSRYGTLLLNSIPRQDVTCTSSILLKFRGEPFDLFGKHYEGSAQEIEFAQNFTALTEKLLAEGKLIPHPVKLGRGGLGGLLDGLEAMRNGQVSGEKLVYRVTDTP
ncbi:putative alcohol dehydrogenase [Xylogone sp. PMI_703]|nr:putative alcohol dehydrogenase [Xylogone sp. PMI_703]